MTPDFQFQPSILPEEYELAKVAAFEKILRQGWERILGEEDTIYLRELMSVLYFETVKNRLVYKSHALSLIPVNHSVTAQKYIKKATLSGWIECLECPEDKRKTIICLTWSMRTRIGSFFKIAATRAKEDFQGYVDRSATAAHTSTTASESLPFRVKSSPPAPVYALCESCDNWLCITEGCRRSRAG